MIEGAATVAAINYASTQAMQGEADPTRGSGGDVAKGKVNPSHKPDNMYEESNSQKDSSSRETADDGVNPGRIINLLG